MTQDHDSTPASPIAGTPDCERALAEVYTFLDQELNEAHRTEIMAHLEACSPCFEAFDFEAELRMVVTTKTHSVDMPETLRIRIEEKLTYLRIQGSGGVGPDDGGEPGRGA
jgi:mycothiol system anti-sigma-R factor